MTDSSDNPRTERSGLLVSQQSDSGVQSLVCLECLSTCLHLSFKDNQRTRSVKLSIIVILVLVIVLVPTITIVLINSRCLGRTVLVLNSLVRNNNSDDIAAPNQDQIRSCLLKNVPQPNFKTT